MASKEHKNEGNVPGKFYVDYQCIDCDLCREICPACFQRDIDGGFSIVARQPEGEEEISLCEEALESCPAHAIGSDG
ncbi:MAG: ferredoxin [Puniceicoccales bacterium]|nr:ferredoxin [Puniceicoccales bacterium]